MARDRVYINSNYRSLIEEMKNSDLLGFGLVETKEIFMLAVALGLDDPEEVKHKDGYFLTKYLKTADRAMVAAVLLGTAINDDEIDTFADLDQSLDLCEKCAESGFRELKKKINEARSDRELLERRFMKELDLWYMQYIESALD